MKTLLRLSLFAAALVAAALAAPPAPNSPAAIPARRLQALQQAKTAIVAQRLGLSDAQKAQAKAVRARTAASIETIRANPALTPDQKREQVAAAEKTGRAEWQAQLTPEQRTKLTAIMSQPKELNALATRRVRMAAIAREIGVTPEQQATLRTARDKTAATMKGIRDDATLTPAQKQLQVREVLQAQRAETRAALTPEQRAKLEKVRQRLLAPLGALAAT